jgi:enoyl-CoA hydratase
MAEPTTEAVTVNVKNGVVVVEMNGPRGNALSPNFIRSLSKGLYQAEQALGDVDNPQAFAVVLSGKPTVFCGGLDLKEADTFDRPALCDFVDLFEALFLQLFAFRAPVIAAMRGPAIAGGAVLALACDERVAPLTGPFEFGLNEVTLGLPFPSAALEIARFSVGQENHVDVLMRGTRFDRAESLQRALIDELAADPVESAIARAQSFVGLGVRAVQKVKADLRHDALTKARAKAIESRRYFAESFSDPKNVVKRRALLADLSAKKA